MNQDRLHRQVRALLAIAEDPAASPAERDTAMREVGCRVRPDAAKAAPE